MRLEGSLDAFSLPDIFSLLSMTKKTGGLHLRRADSHGVVWLGDGLITGGSSDLERLALGRRLAGSGHVADEALSAAVEQVAANSEIGLARALRDAGGIDEGELHTIVSEHIVDSVFDLMRWPDGIFEFVIDEPNVDDVGIKREVEEVVTEARRRIEGWSSIDERVAGSSTVLWLSLDLADEPQLSREEWALLALVDGRRTVGDLATLTGRGEYAVAVALTELVGRGLIRTDESEGVASMARRQGLIASLESAAPAVAEPEPELEPEAVAEPAVEPEAVADIEPEAAVAAEEPDDDADEHVAEVSSLPSRDLSAVTPQRPEPFMPAREPDHPEPLAAAIAGGGVVAAPATAIERDPSVNKSLLLRLIAGVRGL
ncbi:MAG: DUF4388 domain-containing protein [Frankiaceae bacterium]|nr:DUF4388 domain-containing protein [Frankiaceae bacterium]